jgi:hypothetical protein
MKRLAIVSVLSLLAAGLIFPPKAAPKAPARSVTSHERAEWHEGAPKHWKAIVLRKD